MSEERDDQERPCLHCMMVELIDDFFAEYPVEGGEPDTIDTDEVITAVAKTVAELTCKHDNSVRQQIIETLMREIMGLRCRVSSGRHNTSGWLCCSALDTR
jgi:hypothetical protein